MNGRTQDVGNVFNIVPFVSLINSLLYLHMSKFIRTYVDNSSQIACVQDGVSCPKGFIDHLERVRVFRRSAAG